MHTKSLKNSNDIRMLTLQIFFGLSFSVLLLRLFQIQVIDHTRYELAAKDQHWGQFDIPASRGDILSADDSLLAGTQTYYLLYADPSKIVDKTALANQLADYFSKVRHMELVKQSSDSAESETSLKEHLLARYIELFSRNLQWVPIEHRITPEQRDEIINFKNSALGFENEPVRFYPEDSLAAHVLGFVASDEKGENQGYFGIEGAYNQDLKGRKGRLSEEVDASGVPILIGSSKLTEAIPGSTIHLTIDRAIQYIVEQKLKEGVEKYDAKSGTVIVMDPFTGSIVAMANYPTYSPSMFNDEQIEGDKSDKEAEFRKKIERRNMAIAETYEPGSIMKPLTIATAVDLGLIEETTTFEDKGPVNYSGAWINNWDGKHHGTQTIVELLQRSNNIGAAWVGHKVGAKQLYKYFAAFGLGTRTNIDLEGEDTGILRDYDDWTDIDLANISFGQGISATPLQMLNAFNALANGGFLLQPRIVSRIDDKGKDVEFPTKVKRRVIKKDTSDRMVSMLEKTAEGGEAKFFVLKNYRIAGKTGTAQIPINGKYDPNKTNASFVGFLASSKKFSMLVKLQEPRSAIFASETAVPIWMAITKELVKFYNIPPDKEISPQ